jgi:hypothetical protein
VSRQVASFLALTALLGATFVLSLALGSTSIPAGEVWSILRGANAEPTPAAMIVETIRLPRALTAALAGAALGIAGLLMQTLFRNPLADPFALGVSSGASLGVAVVVLGTGYGGAALFGSALGLAGDAAIIAAAILGALAVLGVVLAVASRIESPTTVLVLGESGKGTTGFARQSKKADQSCISESLVIEGAGVNGNLGQDVTPEARSQVFNVTAYKRAIDIAGVRARTEQTRTPGFTYFQGQQPQTQIIGIDGSASRVPNHHASHSSVWKIPVCDEL